MSETTYKKEWFGETAHFVEHQNDYSRIQYDCKGYGDIVSYEVFPGISLVFMDFLTPDIFGEPGEISSNIIEIRHCEKGRVEFEFPGQKVSHMQQGEFCINAAAAALKTSTMPMGFSFPYEYFQGLSLVIDKDSIDNNTKELCSSIGIDIMAFGNDLDLHKSWYIIYTPESLSHIFAQLYAAKEKEKMGFFRVKVLELLYHAGKLKNSDRFEAAYFSKQHIEIVRRVRGRLIEDLGENLSLKSLIEDEDISMVTFQAIFKQVYSDSPYSYLKKYKMNYAAIQLRESEDKINEIAMKVGYNNASKFSKAFVDVFGVLPKDYRKKQ